MTKFKLSTLKELLPSGLYESLTQNTTFVGESLQAAFKFEDWFENSGTPFFKQYTDHSFWHSIDVFRTASELISKQAYGIVSSEDLNILFLACLAHDAGLHITEAMFSTLTNRRNNEVLVPSMDDLPWPTLWDEFIAEAKRFDQKRLFLVFGDIEPVRDPPKDALSFTDRDRLLIGEFLRRYHPRLAHEIAINGIAAGAIRIEPLSTLNDHSMTLLD